jgi:ketosteroid isomerase-like protein
MKFGAAVLCLCAAGDLAAQRRPDIDSIVRQFHINYSNDEVAKIGQLVTGNLVVYLNGGAGNTANGAAFHGREEFVAWLERNKAMFADGASTDHDVVVSGNMAAIRFTLEGTHTGAVETPGGTLRATGREVRIEGTEFFTFDDSAKLVRLETLANDLSAVAPAPGLTGLYEMVVERLEDGEVPPFFHDVAEVGIAFEVRGPLGGHFAWDAQDGGPLLFIGGGSGIAPLMLVARHRATAAGDVAAVLLQAARTFDDLIFYDELLACDLAEAGFNLILSLPRTGHVVLRTSATESMQSCSKLRWRSLEQPVPLDVHVRIESVH